MKKEIKKLQLRITLLALLTVAAICFFWWFFSKGFLVLKVFPVNAIVTIDNAPHKTTRTGKVRARLSAGTHQLKVEADNYVGFSQNITSRRGFINTLSMTLKEVPNPDLISKNGTFLAKGKEDNSIVYLSESDNTIYKTNFSPDNNKKIKKTTIPLTGAKIKDISEIIWGPNKDLALFRKSDGIYLFNFQRYDFQNQTETLWGSNIGSIAWAPDNSKIAYFYSPAGGEKTLIFADLLNQNPERVLDFASLGIDSPLFRWSSDSKWLLIVANGNVYKLNAYNKKFDTLDKSGKQIDAEFNFDEKILYSSKVSSDEFNTSIMDETGENKESLGINMNLRKVAFTKNNLILSTLFDSSLQQTSIYKFDLEAKQIVMNMRNFEKNQIIRILTIFDDKVITYQTKEGIYAVKIE